MPAAWTSISSLRPLGTGVSSSTRSSTEGGPGSRAFIAHMVRGGLLMRA